MDIQQAGGISVGSAPQNSIPNASAKTAPNVVDTANSSAPTIKVAPDAVQAVTRPVDINQVKHAVDKVNKVVQAMGTDLRFTVDEDTGIHVVKVIDLADKSVIRQIPSEEMLAIAKGLDQLQGLLVKQKV